MKDDFANLRAERDEPTPYRGGYSTPAQRSGSLTLQIALGIWLGGMALGLTGFVLNLLLVRFGATLLLG